MHRRHIWLTLVSLAIVSALILSSCGKTPPETTSPTTTPTTTPTTKPTTTTTTAPTSTPTTKPTTTPTVTPSSTPLSKLETPKYGGTYVYATQSVTGTESFDTLQAGSTIEYPVSFIYERMGRADRTKGPGGTNEWPYTQFSYMPEKYRTGHLAESWEWPDPNRIVFHLRQGIRFQNIAPVNGREMVANDVVASWERYKASKTHENDKMRTIPETIKALDKYTVEVTMTSPVYFDPIQIFAMSTRNLVHAAEMLIQTKGDLTDWRYACGTGPFMVTDVVRSSSISYKKNPDYWGYDEFFPKNKLPYVDEVKYLVILDWSTMLSALRTGKIDWVTGIAPDDAASLKKTNPELKYISSIEAVAKPKVTTRNDLKPFDDVKVRRALCMAIDRETIIKEYLKGEGIALSWPMSAGWGEDIYTPMEKLPAAIREIYEYHPDKAKQLLADAGYPNGFETEILTTQSYLERSQIIGGYWAKIGVKVKYRVAEQAAYTSEIYGRKYPGICAANAGQSEPANTLSYYLSTAYYNYGEGRYPYYDEIVNKINITVDPVERNKLIKDINVWFLENAVNFAFPAQYVYYFWQPWVKNYFGEANQATYQIGTMIARVWVDQTLKKSMGR